MYFRGLLYEMGFPPDVPTVLKVDNSGAVDLSKHRTSNGKTRHVDRRFFKCCELAASGAIRVEWIPTADNTADIMTKVLDTATFEKHKASLVTDLAT
eukprot:1566893-Prymnesium_polylepis.2